MSYLVSWGVWQIKKSPRPFWTNLSPMAAGCSSWTKYPAATRIHPYFLAALCCGVPAAKIMVVTDTAVPVL